MNDLMGLYQEMVLDHNRRPRNLGKLERSNRKADGVNPLCGDRVTVYLEVQDGILKGVSFEGAGCAISTASASMMTEALVGKTEAEAAAMFGRFHDMVTGKVTEPEEPLGKLGVFSGVCEYPARVKCATLAWHTMQAALRNEDQTISTE